MSPCVHSAGTADPDALSMAATLPADTLAHLRITPKYDLGMSDRKTRLTVTIDPHLAAYAEQLVEAGKAPSVSAVVNDALEADRLRDQKARRLWKEAAEHADPAKVARMRAHVDAQLAALPASHRHR
jgi:Arc/MetJ-type ribon-helix-helix transcriptional regulator